MTFALSGRSTRFAGGDVPGNAIVRRNCSVFSVAVSSVMEILWHIVRSRGVNVRNVKRRAEKSVPAINEK